jgi:intracellular multiplication protein IcmO
MDSRSASSEKRARLDLQDLKEQREGEATIFFKSKIIRARMFYADPKPVERIRLNHFLKVEPPVGRVLLDFEHRLEQFNILLEGGQDIVDQVSDEAEDINFIADIIHSDMETNLIERGVSALLAFHNRTEKTEEEVIQEREEEVSEESTDEATHIHIFNKARLSAEVKSLLAGPGELERFSQPLIIKAYVKDKIELLERVLGRSGSQAKTVTSEIIKDMLVATDYPPYIEGIFLDIEQLCDIARELTEYVISQEATEGSSGSK